MPSAPPEPPSPMTAAMMGTSSSVISRRLTAMASAMWRSSARDAGIRARRVNQRDDGQAEFVREPHQAQRLAVAFGMRGAEVAQNVFLGVAAFLRADDHDAVFAQLGKTADHRAVLGEQAVAVQFLKIRESVLDVIQRVRPLGMARELDALPGGEVQENLPAGFLQFFFDELDFLLEADAQRMFLRMRAEFIQLVLQFDDRLFEIELMFHALEILSGFCALINAEFRPVIRVPVIKKRKAGLASGLRGDEV